jgi:predicted phosphodiesterase
VKLKKVLIIPDSHIPYHCKRSVGLLYKVARDFKPDVIITLGDYADFYAVSSHSKDPRRALNLEFEVEAVNEELDKLDSLGAKEKIFIAGNHEDRLERYLMDKAPELFNIVKIPELFKLRQRGWKYVPYKNDYQIGKLNLTHDCGSAGRNAVFNAASVYQHNIAIGHTHRLCYSIEGNAKGVAHVSASFGWLGDARKADYMHKVKANRDWALGFGIGYLNPSSGTVYINPVPIVQYTCVVEGKLYVG